MVEIKRGEFWWASLPNPIGSGPGYRRPVVIIQSNEFNRSRIRTVIVAAMTTNLDLAAAPGNVLCRKKEIRLRRDSVVLVSSLLTIDRRLLSERISILSDRTLQKIDAGIRLVLNL